MAKNTLPLVYSCSGCSQVAQLANRIAVRLDRSGQAEMSCIAGVGGNVKPLLRKARQAESIIAIDGCPLACVRHCLEKAGITRFNHVLLSDLGLKKHADEEYSDVTEQQVIAGLLLNRPEYQSSTE
ncbi:putative zinc-binding protein [Thalassolituus sp. LLYu03]|uniref:Zinc-binding protein n=1 Tax=Thalassolituus marinus TaxID=671053 RepID=A0ABS7ZPV8_9GAMM|nr:putative zinc-binding protein [Thalassolituus marinus]MCA6063715.1 putative zinc-binding protein [Thalassolituus marinus]